LARGSPTDADRSLSAYLARFGYGREAPTFEYWRGRGALPLRDSPGLGRGRGRGSEDSPETAALALGICRFLDKDGGIADRPDLPRRRRVAEAPVWLWYEGYPVPNEAVRNTVCACYLGLGRRFEQSRNRAKEQSPQAAPYEVVIDAAELEVEGLLDSALFRRQVRAFARISEQLEGSPPRALAKGAASQLIQALQGQADPEPGVFAAGIESPLILSGVSTSAVMGDQAAERLAERLSIVNIVKTVRRLGHEDWDDIRAAIRAIQGMTMALRVSGDPAARRAGRATPLLNQVTRFVSAIGALAVNLDELREHSREAGTDQN
jgi:hypothetical protein